MDIESIQRIDDQLSAIREELLTSPQYPNLLWHYTGVDGLQGIIEARQWWATHYLYLNDGKEITYGDDLVKEELESLFESECDDRLKEAFMRSKGCDLQMSSEILFDYYILSFSKEGDSLDQWRAYGDDGAGYSIGFEPLKLVESLKIKLKGQGWLKQKISILKVEYAEVEQRKRIEQTIHTVRKALRPAFANASNVSQKQHIDDWAAGWLTGIRLALALSFKHSAFQSEKEWRIVVRRVKSVDDNPSFEIADVDYRRSLGKLIPFLKLEFQPDYGEELLPLIQIMVGPKHNQDPRHRAKQSLEMLLSAKGYRNDGLPLVKVSKIPYQE